MSNNDAQQNNYEEAAIKAAQTMASYLEQTQKFLKETTLPVYVSGRTSTAMASHRRMNYSH